MTLGVAADMAEEPVPVDLAELIVGELQRFAEAHGEDACPQREIRRRPEREVGGERERRDDLGAANAGILPS